MGENTTIAWADHSWSPWMVKSAGTRVKTSDAYWRKPLTWDREAACNCGAADHGPGECEACSRGCPRPRVFPSLCDPFEDWASNRGNQKKVIDAYGHDLYVPKPTGFDNRWEPCTLNHLRRDLFGLIWQTPNLDWLLLTRRPENIWPMWEAVKPFPASTQFYRENVHLLYSASDQDSLEVGIGHLLECRNLVPVLGLSLEPLVGPIDLSRILATEVDRNGEWRSETKFSRGPSIDGVIVGGESGPRARPCQLEWILDIAQQCGAAGVPCFVKQDSGPKPGLQGRIPDEVWKIKQHPKVKHE